MLLLLPLDLSGDEAYYWEWGRHLDWGYVSKPPGIAWIMAGLRVLGADTVFGIRLFSLLLSSGGLALLFFLGRSMYDARTGLMAALVFALTPANCALSFLLTIDAPLLLCWTGAMLGLWRMLDSERSEAWSALILALFLTGGLLSKQMALCFYPLTFLMLLVCPAYRPVLKSPWFWTALILPLLALLPTLVWNAQHDWVTFSHTSHHFETGSPTLTVRLVRFFEFLGSGLGLLTPLIGVLMGIVLLAALFRWRSLESRERFLWVFNGLGLLVLTLLTFRQRINPNWPAIFVPGGLLLTTAWYFGHWSVGISWVKRSRWAFRPGLVVALGACVLFYGFILAFSWKVIGRPGLNPVQRLQEWSRLAGEISALHAAQPDPKKVFFITQGHRYMTSELAFYLPGRPQVYPFIRAGHAAGSQHALWGSPRELKGNDALIVVYGVDTALDTQLVELFDEVTLLKEFDLSQSPSGVSRPTVYLGRNLRNWPNLNPDSTQTVETEQP